MRRLITFLKDQRGVSAVEFAFVAPVMIVAYFGLAEMSQGMMADSKTGRVASAIGDLAAQDTQLTNAEVADIFKIGKILVQPFSSDSLQMRVSSLTALSATQARVDWSDGSGMGALSGNQTIPTGLVTTGQTIILAETKFTYTSPVAEIAPNAITFTRRYYLRPRKSDTVLRCGATC